ncbi:FAD-binding oxidoreductase [uncultured Thiothrix sp.]|uniref:FAD-binding oxidoreductase n=1 Tax=uncultured Thiothrix sp. TaxID=223185 RepID=UPI00260EBEB8|nr:FAD-binding oxidoreductase [uncultured Thiothrix sp.]HMT94213.1 FAD-binding oxidoreductase [Thiolinea sp.]
MSSLTRREALKTLLTALAIPVASQVEWAFADSNLPQIAGQLYFLKPTDTEYAQRRQIFNKRIGLMPRLIAVCLSDKGVQTAMQYAAANNLPVAVKSGGHCFEGYSLNNNGLLIDLSLLKSFKYTATDQSFTTQPGAKLGDVYAYLAQFKRLIPAGSCAGVGVAGLTLGGGYGFFARQLGLTCDSLTRVKLVDGQGKLLDSKDNAELLWACKGGNNGSLGIVTELQFKTHPTPTNFTNYRFKYRNLTANKVGALAERWFSLMPNLPTTCYSSWVLGPTQLTILITDIAERSSPLLQTILRQLGKDATTVQGPQKDEFLRGIQRFRGGTEPMYFKNISAGYYNSYADIKNVLPHLFTQMQASALKQNLIQINTLGGAIRDGFSTASAAYPHRNYAYLGEFQVYYQRSRDTPNAEAFVNQVQQQFTQAGIKAHYANYPDIGLKNWAQAYYADSYPRLQALKRKLDPNNRIQHPQSIRL